MYSLQSFSRLSTSKTNVQATYNMAGISRFHLQRTLLLPRPVSNKNPNSWYYLSIWLICPLRSYETIPLLHYSVGAAILLSSWHSLSLMIPGVSSTPPLNTGRPFNLWEFITWTDMLCYLPLTLISRILFLNALGFSTLDPCMYCLFLPNI